MSIKKKILIVGSNGMLGKDITSFFTANNDYEVYTINRNKDFKVKAENSYICDIRNEDELKGILGQITPNIIIHCAAIVNVDECEKDKDRAFRVNAKSAEILAAYNPNETKLVYISTDSIFDGFNGNYNEGDVVNPLNYYAQSKHEGEKLAMGMNDNCLIIRTNIYGFHENEGMSLAEWALNNIKEGNSISGFNDVYFNPLYTKQLAKAIFELISIDYKGIINTGCENFVSKYDFLIMLSEVFNIDRKLINASSVEDINFTAKRPKNTTLNVNKFKNLIGYEFNLGNGLEEFKKDYEEYLIRKGGCL